MLRVIMRSRVAGSFQQDFFKNKLIRSLAVVISLFQQRNIDRSGRETVRNRNVWKNIWKLFRLHCLIPVAPFYYAGILYNAM